MKSNHQCWPLSESELIKTANYYRDMFQNVHFKLASGIIWVEHGNGDDILPRTQIKYIYRVATRNVDCGHCIQIVDYLSNYLAARYVDSE